MSKDFGGFVGVLEKEKTTKPNQVFVESADVLSSLRSSRAAPGGQTRVFWARLECQLS